MMLKWSALSALLLLRVAPANGQGQSCDRKCVNGGFVCDPNKKFDDQCGGKGTYCKTNGCEPGNTCYTTCSDGTQVSYSVASSGGKVIFNNGLKPYVLAVKSSRGYCPYYRSDGDFYSVQDGSNANQFYGVSHIDLCTCKANGQSCTSPSECCGTFCNRNSCGATSQDDPWVTGLAGQLFEFTPIEGQQDSWYAAVSDDRLQINLKLHKYDGFGPTQPENEFWVGASVQTFDEDGFAAQSLLIEARDADNFDFSCKDLGANAPKHCLGGGAYDIFVNGVRMMEGGQVQIGAGYELGASNIPSACLSVTGHQMDVHPLAEQSRDLMEFDFDAYVLGRPVRAPDACERWIEMAQRVHGDIYQAPGIRFTVRYVTPVATALFDFDTHLPHAEDIDQVNTYQTSFNLPRIATVEGTAGIIGETAHVRYGADAEPIMAGKVLKGADEDYRVDGPFGRDFKAKSM